MAGRPGGLSKGCRLPREPNEARPPECSGGGLNREGGRARREAETSAPAKAQGTRRQAIGQSIGGEAETASHASVDYFAPCAERGRSFAPSPRKGLGSLSFNSFPRAAGPTPQAAQATNLPRREVPVGLTSSPPELDHDPINLPNAPQPFRDWLLSF